MSGYLLDTHVVIWCFTNDPTLSQEAREIIVDEENDIFASAVSAWEMTIKKALAKLNAPGHVSETSLHSSMEEREGREGFPPFLPFLPFLPFHAKCQHIFPGI